jgi:putative membrane protein insertion efficiency factor
MIKKALSTLMLLLIRFYQLSISPLLGSHCRHTPSCSVYTAEAIRSWGPRRGIVLGAKRIARCHPWGTSGYDPVPQRQQGQNNRPKNQTMNTDQEFMRQALELARRGEGQVSPNPMVGCVIVKDQQVITRGWHKKYGQAHAERDAVEQLEDPSLLAGSTVYVNLEPCSHHGKTPPCCDLLIRHKVARVVIANIDPNPLVNGVGIRKMREAGIEVECGVLAEEAAVLNRDFFRRMEHKKNIEKVN